MIQQCISTHYLTQRQTKYRNNIYDGSCISTHYLTQRQTLYTLNASEPSLFQLTTSRRGRREYLLMFLFPCIFQLTTSRRGRQLNMISFLPVHQFQLTTSRRGRRCLCGHLQGRRTISTHYLTQRQTTDHTGRKGLQQHFNSLPHAEVDHSIRVFDRNNPISTHYLTQRQTVIRTLIGIMLIISTHYLTQRQTIIEDTYGAVSYLFQLTTSRRGRPPFLSGRPYSHVYFNSLPHAEVDSNLSQNLWTLTIDSITNRIINLCFLL